MPVTGDVGRYSAAWKNAQAIATSLFAPELMHPTDGNFTICTPTCDTAARLIGWNDIHGAWDVEMIDGDCRLWVDVFDPYDLKKVWALFKGDPRGMPVRSHEDMDFQIERITTAIDAFETS